MNKIVQMPNWMLFGEDNCIQKDSYVELLGYCDAATLRICTAVSQNWCEVVNTFMPSSCPGLTIFTVESYLPHFTEVHPSFNRFKVLEFVEKLGLKIEKDAKCTIMPVLKGMTVSSLCKLAESVGMKVSIFNSSLTSHVNELSEEDTHCIVMTNTLLENSRDLSFEERRAAFEKTKKEVGIAIKIPSVQTLIAFNILSFVHGRPFFKGDFMESSFAIEAGDYYSAFVGRSIPDTILITLVRKGEDFGCALCMNV